MAGMLKGIARGGGIALWGLLMWVPATGFTAGFTWSTLAMLLFTSCWGIYYALRPITWRTAGLQLVSVWVFTALLSLLSHQAASLEEALVVSILYRTGYLVTWMAPVALMAYMLVDWRARKATFAARSVSPQA
ncbi:hypothetical protein BW733_16860 [Tessaracoccus flavescens]|uniref:Uncharacterized protein n=2 Tax=Tessaracoccus flavescens TaxID=399497 RepID=A0A1Q2D1L4_9ACTN|nr:hypothetical protein BW733_16860 [Tessaracoccus flavescens]